MIEADTSSPEREEKLRSVSAWKPESAGPTGDAADGTGATAGTAITAVFGHEKLLTSV